MAFNNNSPRAEYTAIAGQTSYTFLFQVFSDTDLVVYSTPVGIPANDDNDLLTLGVDYTVDIQGSEGGTVTLLTPSTMGDGVTLTRSLPITREVEYQERGDLRASTLNDDQDYQTQLLNDQSVKNSRYVRLPESSQNVSTDLPSPESQQFLRWNTDGTALINAEGTVQEITEFNDSEFTITNGSKEFRFDASNISAATERVIAIPDNNGTVQLVTSQVQTEGQDWDGITYIDPDAIGANPQAKIYPDGTIIGSTDYGEYTKYPNGDLTMRRLYSRVWSTGSYTLTISAPCEITEGLHEASLSASIGNFEKIGAQSSSNDWLVGVEVSSSASRDVNLTFIGRWK